MTTAHKSQLQGAPKGAELRRAWWSNGGLFLFVGLFSIFTNLLLLTGPLYMLQVYDRVLSSRSVETLVALTLLVAFLFGVMGVLDMVRARVMSRAAARFQSKLDRRVFDAVIQKSAIVPGGASGAKELHDLSAIQRAMTSPAALAFFDIPWTPIFLAGIALFHPWLGILALAGGGILIVVTLLNQWLTRLPQQSAAATSMRADNMASQIQSEGELIGAMGMRDAAFQRWRKYRAEALEHSVAGTDRSGAFTSASKTFRLFLQSAMLGLGAYLVLLNELSPGAMIAGSILLGRALAPIELLIGNWALIQRAMTGWRGLADLLDAIPPEGSRTALPVPRGLIDVQQISVVPPGLTSPVVRGLSFTVQPGQAVGVIGPSGAGKSTLARALTGAWPAALGKIRLDGAALDQYDPATLGRHIGYLPQRVQMFEGTVAENIARLAEKPDDAAVVAAAKKAAAHEMILSFPDGYDTQLSAHGGRLSGGQMQRIALARALYGNPVVLVLDEPNSNLDHEGGEALNQAIRSMKQEGKSALIMAHRPAAIQECDMLLMMDDGQRVAYGPRDEVLKKVTQNHTQLIQGGKQ